MNSIRTIYATNNDGKNAFIEISFFTESATAGTNASVSNWSLQFVQDQKLRTSRSSIKYSDHSGAISVSPHFLQVISWLELRMDATVVMIISWLLLIVLPLRAQGCNNSAAFKFLARRFKLIFDQKNCATSRPLFGLLLNLRDEIIPLLRCNIRRACQPMSSSGTSKRCPIFAGFGSMLLPGPLLLARSPFLFGYAKQVPVNFGALRNPRIGMMLVAARCLRIDEPHRAGCWTARPRLSSIERWARSSAPSLISRIVAYAFPSDVMCRTNFPLF